MSFCIVLLRVFLIEAEELTYKEKVVFVLIFRCLALQQVDYGSLRSHVREITLSFDRSRP